LHKAPAHGTCGSAVPLLLELVAELLLEVVVELELEVVVELLLEVVEVELEVVLELLELLDVAPPPLPEELLELPVGAAPPLPRANRSSVPPMPPQEAMASAAPARVESARTNRFIASSSLRIADYRARARRPTEPETTAPGRHRLRSGDRGGGLAPGFSRAPGP
jgi:hypothetical protein